MNLFEEAKYIHRLNEGYEDWSDEDIKSTMGINFVAELQQFNPSVLEKVTDVYRKALTKEHASLERMTHIYDVSAVTGSGKEEIVGDFGILADAINKANSLNTKAAVNLYIFEDPRGFSEYIKNIYSNKDNGHELKEAAGFPKYYLALNHFEPDDLFTVKIKNEKELHKLENLEDWFIEDITDEHGFYLIGHSDEAFYLNKLPASNKEALRKLMVDELKQQIKEDEEFFDYPETHLDCIDEDISLDLDLSEDDDEAAAQIADNWFESIDDSYVDGDSNFRYEFVNMDDWKKGAWSYSELFEG